MAACSVASSGLAGSVIVRQTRFGTELPVISTFWQTFLGLAGLSVWWGSGEAVVAGAAADRERASNSGLALPAHLFVV